MTSYNLYKADMRKDAEAVSKNLQGLQPFFFFNITAFFAHDQVVIRGNNIFVEILSLKKIIYEFHLLRKNNYKC